MSKWAPKKWNDTLSLLILIGYVAVVLVLIVMSVEREVLLLVVGILLSQVQRVVDFYFRKAPPDGPQSA